jgi:signal transduction histidine kinase/CheY-like chemotaxis protein
MTQGSVRAEQVKTLYGQSLPVLSANVINAAIVSAVLWSSERRPLLVAFTALMALMTAARFELRRRYWRARPGADEARLWGNRFVMGSATAGLLWGAAAGLFFDGHSPVSQILIAFVIGGMGAGAAGTLSCYMPAFIAFIVPALVPLIVRTLLFGDLLHLAMGGMVLVFGLGLSMVARTTNRSILQAFRLRFENDDLVRRLSESQATLEQRVAERSAALEKQSEALRDARRLEAVGRLAGGIAHDFNNLLTVVFAHVGFLRKEPDLAENVRTAVDDVENIAARGAALVRQLLAFSRQQRLAPRVFDLNQVVRDLQRLLAPILGAHVDLRLALGPDTLLIKADPSQIEQVIVNLVTNARDAMPRGGTLTITTSQVEVEGDAAVPAGSYVVLSVTDTGVGMDEGTRLRAFEPFFTTKEVGRGSGLGLATVYGVVEQSGGHISVESEPGAGTELKVYLPRTLEELREPATQPEMAPEPRRATILLVEDEPDVRSVIDRMLRLMGHEVLAAASSDEALALWRDHARPIDLLVTDVVMAGRAGPELARLLTAELPRLRVLLISGYRAEEELPASDPAYGMDYLQKPMTFETLRQKVSALLALTPAVTTSNAPAERPARK